MFYDNFFDDLNDIINLDIVCDHKDSKNTNLEPPKKKIKVIDEQCIIKKSVYCQKSNSIIFDNEIIEKNKIISELVTNNLKLHKINVQLQEDITKYKSQLNNTRLLHINLISNLSQK